MDTLVYLVGGTEVRVPDKAPDQVREMMRAVWMKCPLPQSEQPWVWAGNVGGEGFNPNFVTAMKPLPPTPAGTM